MSKGTDSHKTGVISELMVCQKLVERGCEIFLPIMTQSKADLIFYDQDSCNRVQVKTLSAIKSGPYTYLQVRLRGGSSSKWQRNYKEDDFEYLILVYQGRIWMIPWGLVWENTSLSIGRVVNGIIDLSRVKRGKIDFSCYEI